MGMLGGAESSASSPLLMLVLANYHENVFLPYLTHGVSSFEQTEFGQGRRQHESFLFAPAPDGARCSDHTPQEDEEAEEAVHSVCRMISRPLAA